MLTVLNWLGVKGSVLLAALLVLGTYTTVQQLKWKAHMATDAIKEASAAMAREAMHRQFEERVNGINKDVAEFIAKRELREKELNRIILDLRSGKLPINPRLQCNSPASPGGNGEAGHGVQTEDAEFLVRESDKADEQGHALKLLQEWADRIMGVKK